VGTATALYMLLGGGLGAVVCLLSPWLASLIVGAPGHHRADATLALLLMGFNLLIGFWTGVYTNTLAGLQRFDITTKLAIILGTITAVATIITAMVASFSAFLIALELSEIAALFVYIWQVHLVLPSISLKPALSRRITRQLLGFSGLTMIEKLSWLIYTRLDQFVITGILGVAFVAYYTVPVGLTLILFYVSDRITPVLLPMVAELQAYGDLAHVRRIYAMSVKGTFLLIMPAAVVMSVAAHPLLVVWIGKAYAVQGSAVLSVTAIAMAIASITSIPINLAIGLGHPKIAAIRALSGIAINVAGCIVLIPLLHLLGAALTLALTYLMPCPIFIGYVSRRNYLGLLG